VYEGQPISIIGALAFGLVDLSTPHCTIPEMLKEGEPGELVPFDQLGKMAHLVGAYMREPERYEAMSRYREASPRRPTSTA